ncbi:MAG: nitroreductase family protein [Alphaproteobacteria bacterium]|nr:nitroreductase family protein [Alphaproteobacteria bacterium]
MRGELAAALDRRFGDADGLAAAAPHHALGGLTALATHRVIRGYSDRPVDPALVRLLCAAALSAPSKSDMQARDLIVVTEAATRERLVELCGKDHWMPSAPVWIVACGNHRRQRQIHEWRGPEFVNDHLDAFFNASVDAAIVLGWFVAAAETAGLGCCPISQIRNHPREVSELLGLPDRVFPVAGLTLGWPANAGVLSPRLPLAATVHHERFDDGSIRELVDGYDRRRHAMMPYRRQRDVARFGEATLYGWSEDKARQYAEPQRADFGAYVRAQGFKLD